MNKTKIEYLVENGRTWNPLVMRCKKLSKGCEKCWHIRMSNRLAKNPLIAPELQKAYAGEAAPVLVESRLVEPLKVKKPLWIAVQFMGDLFQEDVNFNDIWRIFDTISSSENHTFLILTKRINIVLKFIQYLENEHRHFANPDWWPNIYWGTSVENQKQADLRIPQLLQIPGKKWLSVEPMLEGIDFEYESDICHCGEFADHSPFNGNHTPVPMIESHLFGIDWVTCGAETGPKARPFKNEWALDLLEQCKAANVPFFMKKGEGKELPPELMVREYPE